MSRAAHVQFNVRSAFARNRARELARLTGMTATQVVEEALRAYVPPGAASNVPGPVRRGPLLVLPSNGTLVSLEEANQALEQIREGDLDG